MFIPFMMVNFHEFIGEVKKREALWNPSNKLHRNRESVIRCWEEISDIFDIDVHTAKQKWKNLRDTFRLEVKKIKKQANELQQPESEIESLWMHYNDMLFLKSLLKTRIYRNWRFHHASPTRLLEESATSEAGTASEDAIKIEVEEHHLEFSPTGADFEQEESNFSAEQDGQDAGRGTKRRLMDNEDDDDDDMLFFRSLMPFVKKLHPDKKLLFRTDVQKKLYDILFSQ